MALIDRQRPDAPPPRAGAPREDRWVILAVLCVPLLIVSLDNTVLNVALPTLVRKLHASDTELQWIVDAYVLVFGGLMLVSGSVSDRIGRKRTFVTGLAVFGVCSAWAAVSGSAAVLIAARACMGIGATLIMPATLSIITDTFRDPEERQRALGLWAGTSGAGVALGPIVGGLLLAHFAWGSVFLINVPIAVLGVGFAVPLVPDSRDPDAPAPDPVGALLSVSGLGGVLWAIIEAPTHGWGSTLVLVSGGAGLAALAVFVAWEARCPHAMLRLEFFRRRSFSAAVASVGIMMFALMGSLFVLTQFLQFQLGYSALQAGVHMLPAAGGIAVFAPLSAVLVARLGTKLTAATGLALVVGGLAYVSRAGVDATYADQLPGMVLIGVGAGLVMPACVGSLMGSLPRANAGVGSATNGTFVQVGGALGVAILGSVMATRYQNQLADALAGHPLPAVLHETVLGSLGAALAVAARIGGAGGHELALAARSAFMSGMDVAFGVGAAVVGVALLVALALLPNRPNPGA